MAKQFISPDNVHKPPTYSHVVKAGNTYYVAGQTALDVNGNLVGPGDVVAQAEQVYKNIRDVLEATGSGLKDVVKITTYLTDAASIPLIREVRQKFFTGPQPAATLVVISQLARPELLIEVEATAVLD